MNFKNRQIEYAVLFIVLSAVLVYFALIPLVRVLHTENVTASSKKQELSQKEQKVEGLVQIQSKLSGLKTDLAMMKNALPKGEEMAGLLVTLEALAGSSGLGVANLAPETKTSVVAAASETSEGGVGKTSATLNLTGSYPAFVSFLENSEANLRPITFGTINLVSGGTQDALTINLNLAAYYQK